MNVGSNHQSIEIKKLKNKDKTNMRKNIFQVTLLASILLFSACSNDSDLPEPTKEKRKIEFTASVSEPSTRVSLDEEGTKINVKWEEGDIIQLIVTPFPDDNVTRITNAATVSKVSDDGKTAYFTAYIENAPAGELTLYGVYGAGGIDVSGSKTCYVLPKPDKLAATTSLADIENKKYVALYFKHEYFLQ